MHSESLTIHIYIIFSLQPALPLSFPSGVYWLVENI